MGPSGFDLDAEGRDGTGRKTEIPWARVYSPSRSQNAREGWYCVYLFEAKGNGFYLTLMHGATRWENGEFVPRSSTELGRLVSWARAVVGPHLRGKMSESITLNAKSKLGDAYERGTVTSIWYEASDIPDDATLSRDLQELAALLSKLYDAEDFGRSPEGPQLEAGQAQAAVIAKEKPSKQIKTGQGYGLTLAERRAVEQFAMVTAENYLLAQGYILKNVSSNRPYDYVATKGSLKKIVEVKGTTGPAASIILTAGEVRAHDEGFPNNILVLVHSVNLDRKSNPPKAAGGTCVVLAPWKVETNLLKPLTYQYSPPQGFVPTE